VTCAKSDRECLYISSTDVATSNDSDTAAKSMSSNTGTSITTDVVSPATHKLSASGDIDPQLFTTSPELMFDSPLTNIASVPSPNSAPLEWYDCLAEDAINNIDKYNLNLELDGVSLSRRHSPAPDTESAAQSHISQQRRETVSSLQEQWNSSDNIPMTKDELQLFSHYIGVVGPILDLCDPSREFSTTVPRLAVHNVGLLKSLLAVAARHQALITKPQALQPNMFAHASGSHVTEANSLINTATQYYYQTLHYLSQNLLYPSYSRSREIIATALLISTYEMFDSEGEYSNGAWERHLRGLFWIQRSQNNNGECNDSLRRATWWGWIRQDIWAAFRERRRVLTIWRPTRRLMDLNPNELCLRIVYICGRCVDFAASEKKYDMQMRIDQGSKLMQALEDWRRALPISFEPIYKTVHPEPGTLFTPIWINPPSYAAAIQTFHFARIIVLINQPSMGGMDEFRVRQRYLDESVDTICGIVMMHQFTDVPSAYVNYQALYAGKQSVLSIESINPDNKLAGLCVQNPAKQTAILGLLETTLDITKFPPKTLLDDLTNYWRGELSS
jgi:hypothetical protein